MMEAHSYDPPAESEGLDNGLVEALADRIWSYRSRYYSAHKRDFTRQSAQCRVDWRNTAKVALDFLFNIGFIGPSGQPDEARFDGLTYGWLYSANTWEILDADGGYVALVNETQDLELMLSAPSMRAAIKDLLAAIPPDHPSRAMPELQALTASLPEYRP